MLEMYEVQLKENEDLICPQTYTFMKSHPSTHIIAIDKKNRAKRPIAFLPLYFDTGAFL